MNNKKTVCFIRSGSIRTACSVFGGLYEHFSKQFEQVFFINVSKVFTSRFIGDPDDKDAPGELPSNFIYIVPKSFTEFKFFLKSHDLVVMCCFSETWPDWWIHRCLRKYSVPLAYIHTHSIAVTFIYNMGKGGSIVSNKWNKLKVRYSRFLRYLAEHYFLCDVDTLFISRKDKAERIKKGGMIRYLGSEVVLTNCRFYDNFLLNSCKTSEDYVVFLDSVVPYTEDQTRFGYQPIDRKLYYTYLIKVLKLIGEAAGKPVLVCLHPKYKDDKLSEDYGDLTTVKYRTDEFIAKAKFVLFHETTSINSAVLHNKKIIQLTGSHFNEFTRNNCKAFQKLFSFPVLDIFEADVNNITETIKSLEWEPVNYDKYISNYAIASGQKGVSSCAQIADHVAYKYNIEKKR